MAVSLAACSGGSSTTGGATAGPTVTAPSTSTTVTTAPPPPGVSPDVLAAMIEASGEAGLVRWPGPEVTVTVGGEPTARDLEVLDGLLAELGARSGLTLALVEGPADLEVDFLPRDAWRNATDGDTAVEPEAPGLTRVGLTSLRWEGDGRVTSALVSVDSTIGQAARNQTLLHELLHALGLGHVACPGSAVHGGGGGDPSWVVGPFDAELIAAWYDPSVPAGSDAAGIESSVEVVADGVGCPTPAVDGRETADGTVWCEATGDGPRPCVFPDGLGEPPTAPFAAPVRWVVDDVLYDHDPSRYERVLYEGRPLLCELEAEGRRPCQFTDGPGPVTSPDLWTDGTFVYPTP